MTVSQLRQHVSATGSHFFDKKTLEFFGDKLSNYKVIGPIEITTISGLSATVWELARKTPVKHGLKSSAYFDTTTYARRYSIATWGDSPSVG